MLLTIHNLPITTRYPDVKSLLHEKCGLTDIIVDNLVNEGKSKKVTVGLANEDDGAFVVRKLNGLFINGQQLYIEHKRRNATVQEQPYQPSANFAQESRGFEQAHINNMVETAMVPNAPIWNQNVTVPYMAHMPAEQNVAYSGYGSVPQTPHYIEPRPVPAQNERGYSGFPENYIPTVTSSGPGHQAPDWSRNGREQPSDAFQYNDRKRRHSPERPAAPKLSRKDRIHAANNRQETARAEPPRQWPEQNQGPRQPYGQPEPSRKVRISAAQQHRQETPRAEPPRQWPEQNQGPRQPYRQPEPSRKDKINAAQQHRQETARAEPPRQWPEQNQGPRQPYRQPEPSRKDKINAAQQHRQETARAEPPRQWPEQNQGPRQPYRQPEQYPRNQHQSVDQYQPREPSPEFRHTDLQWETKRWDEPKAPRPEREREWGDDNRGNWDSQPARGNWDSQPAKVWDNPPEQQWHEEPRRWDIEPKPQWEENYSSMPVEDNRPEWHDRREPVGPPRESNVQEFHPRGQEQYREPRPSRKSRFDDLNRNVARPAASSNRQGRPAEEMQRRDPPRSKNGRQERQYRDDRPNPSRDRSGGPRKPEFGRQGHRDYPEPKRRPAPEFNKRVSPLDQRRPAMQRHERDEMYKRKPFGKEEKEYLFRKPENKPQTLRTLINKDQSNRGQATALIAKTVVGLPKGKTPTDSKSEKFFFKQLKLCIKSRIDVELGEELSTDIGDVVKRYRTKYPINQDKTLLKQIREKAAKEFEEIQETKELEGHKDAKNEIGVKKEAETENDSQKEDVLNQATLQVENETKEFKKPTDSDTGTEAVKKPSAVPPVPPNMPKTKPGKPLTDKQIIQQMKLQRKWEYDQDDLYSLDEVANKALDDEMAEIDKLFTDECSKPEGQQEEAICKRITTDSLNDFNKTIRLYITKRFLNIQTGLSIRIFSQGKLPTKTALKNYLKQYRIFNMTLKKSVKGNMFVVNLTRFDDFDNLCRIEQDVIAGIPVNFKAMHLIGPPPKVTKNQIKAMRERLIQGQIEPDTDLAQFEDTADFGADIEDTEDFEDIGDSEEKEEIVENTEDIADEGDFEVKDSADKDLVEDFGEDINIGNINEEDLEDF